MPRRIQLTIILFCGLLLVSCNLRIGGRAMPKIDPNYVPKKVYPTDFNTVWASTLKALKENQTPVRSVDKGAGLIKTDYQTGPEKIRDLTHIFTRYKYDIKISKETEGKTKLDISCTYEVKTTAHYKHEVVPGGYYVEAFEQELYKIIEPYISH
ncbi:MAG: hypothetical protein ISS63_13540 [Desulfobacteraceae bacterium]|nr:hypothetical protein [Desulfobacteraceae bacterium]